MIRYKLKERIADKEFRERRRISLIEIAEATGIGRITLSRLLNHRSDVRTGTLDKLCAYFGCRLDEIAEYVAGDGTVPGFTSLRRSARPPETRKKQPSKRASGL